MLTIAYTSPGVPPEWIAAHGLDPLRLQPAGAAVAGPVPPTAGICPFMRASLNQAAADDRIRGVVVGGRCDQMRRGQERLRDTGKPVFCLHVPATWQSESALSLYRGELERLSRFLVALGGTPPGRETLQSAIRQRETALRPAPIATAGEGTVPVAVTGGPRSRLDEGLLDLIAAQGGRVVLDASEMGALSEPPPFDGTATDPLRALAESYLRKLPGVARRPNDGLLSWLADRVRQSGAKGVLLLRYLWCDLWHAEAPRIRDALAVPLLDVDLDGEDPVPRNLTRIQAFLESLR